MRKYLLFFLLIILMLNLSFGETVPLLLEGKEVKGENLDGVIIYIAKIEKLEELPLHLDFSIKPEGIFFLFEVYIYNRTNRTILITHENFKLLDDDGRKISINLLGSIYYALKLKEVFFGKKIKPGEIIGGYLIFELNKNNVPYKLNILDLPEKGKNYSILISM